MAREDAQKVYRDLQVAAHNFARMEKQYKEGSIPLNEYRKAKLKLHEVAIMFHRVVQP